MHQMDHLSVSDVQDTSASVDWIVAERGSYTPDGFLLTLRLGGDVRSTKLEGSLLRNYVINGLLPLTDYTVILRPYKDTFSGYYKVGKAQSVSLRTYDKSLPVSTAPPRLEFSIHCQDPIVPSTNITLTSVYLCDELQDCFQGADEMKELCGNMIHMKLSAEKSAVKSVTLTWSVLHPSSPWTTSVEEQRTTLYGKRTEPDGLFVTTISNNEVVTPDVKGLAGRRLMIDNLNSSTIYTFLVRPYVNSTGSRRGYKVGKLLSLSLPTKTTGLQNVTSFHVGNNTALVIWNAEVDADYFRFTYGDVPTWTESSVSNIRSFPNPTTPDLRNKFFSVLLLTSISPSFFNGVACGAQGCSDTTTMRIDDDDARDEARYPVVAISYIAATSPTSLYVNWTVVKHSSLSMDGFWVSYCEEPVTSCRVLLLLDESVRVTGLAPATTYIIKVQPRTRTRSGDVQLGLTSEAKVSTWTDVPSLPALESYHVVTPPCLLHVAWSFYNSTVAYIQVSLENDNWLNCTTTAHCNAQVLENVVESNTTRGSLVLWDIEYFTTYRLLLRGCNDNGCGSNTSIDVSTPIKASSAPVNMSVEQLTDGTALVKWDRPLQPRGPVDGYVVSWKCGEETTREVMVADVQFLITESLTSPSCAASVIAYHIIKEGHQLRGKAAYINFKLTT
ncbi:uncharacterized protein LOC135383686 isoform X2 [Ornithodoros turicata]